jgi:hypothetical protein
MGVIAGSDSMARRCFLAGVFIRRLELARGAEGLIGDFIGI